MNFRRPVHLVGGALTPFIGKHHPDFIWKKHPEFGTRENPTIDQLLHGVINEALGKTGIPAAAVERGYIGNFTGECFVNQGHLGSMAAGAHPDLAGKPFARVEGACASGGLALGWGIDALQAGCDVVLIAGVEVQTTVSARQGADFLARAAHYASQRSIDEFTFPALFARRTKAYFDAFGATHDDLANVATKAYSNANRNPNAHMRTRTITNEWARAASDTNPAFLSNETYRDYLKISDCSQVSDGACAIILASPEGLNKLGLAAQDTVQIRACVQAANALGDPDDLTRLDTTATAADLAYREAGLDAAAIEVAEVHDCFTVTELMMLEALGFAHPGQGTSLTREGATALEGRIPVNTGGGLIAFGHPVGATGVKQVFEIFRQMKGECGDYQLERPPSTGLAANMGGDDRTAVVTILQH